MGKDLKGKEPGKGIYSAVQVWQYNGPLAKISMLKSLEIKGFIGGNIKNETWNCRTAKCRKKYTV